MSNYNTVFFLRRGFEWVIELRMTWASQRPIEVDFVANRLLGTPQHWTCIVKDSAGQAGWNFCYEWFDNFNVKETPLFLSTENPPSDRELLAHAKKVLGYEPSIP